MCSSLCARAKARSTSARVESACVRSSMMADASSWTLLGETSFPASPPSRISRQASTSVATTGVRAAIAFANQPELRTYELLVDARKRPEQCVVIFDRIQPSDHPDNQWTSPRFFRAFRGRLRRDRLYLYAVWHGLRASREPTRERA